MPAEMTTVTYDGRTYRLPFADLFRPLTDDEWAGLRESIESHEVLSQVLTYDSPAHGKDCVIDGANRLTIGAELGAAVPIRKVKGITDAQAMAMAESLNADRRHLTDAERKKRRAERVKRVAQMRSQGMSLPAIADHEGVSVAQVQRDLAKAGSTLPGGKVEPESGKVVGKDGKERPAHPQVSSPEPDADDDPDDTPLLDDDQNDAADPAGGGESTGELAAGESAPAGPPGDDTPAYAKPLRVDANKPFDRAGFIEGVVAHVPAVKDDPEGRVELYRSDFKALLSQLKGARAILTRVLEGHKSGVYLRQFDTLFVDRPRFIRSGRHEGGWYCRELEKVISAVSQARVDALCLACRGNGCDVCHQAGFFPPDVANFRADADAPVAEDAE